MKVLKLLQALAPAPPSAPAESGIRQRVVASVLNDQPGTGAQIGQRAGVLLGRLSEEASRYAAQFTETGVRIYREAKDELERNAAMQSYDALVAAIRESGYETPMKKSFARDGSQIAFCSEGDSREYALTRESERVCMRFTGAYTAQNLDALIGAYREALFTSRQALRGVAEFQGTSVFECAGVGPVTHDVSYAQGEFSSRAVHAQQGSRLGLRAPKSCVLEYAIRM